MLLKALDGQQPTPAQQTIIVQAQEVVVDRSGTVAATGFSQTLMGPNALRSGWLMQNLSGHIMYVADNGVAASTGYGSWAVPAGAIFPPAGFPVTTGTINVIGTAADAFTAREW